MEVEVGHKKAPQDLEEVKYQDPNEKGHNRYYLDGKMD